jgi:hypothetical protein
VGEKWEKGKGEREREREGERERGRGREERGEMLAEPPFSETSTIQGIGQTTICPNTRLEEGKGKREEDGGREEERQSQIQIESERERGMKRGERISQNLNS